MDAKRVDRLVRSWAATTAASMAGLTVLLRVDPKVGQTDAMMAVWTAGSTDSLRAVPWDVWMGVPSVGWMVAKLAAEWAALMGGKWAAERDLYSALYLAELMVEELAA